MEFLAVFIADSPNDLVQAIWYLARGASENPRRNINRKPVVGSLGAVTRDIVLFVVASLLTNSSVYAVPHALLFQYPLPIFGPFLLLQVIFTGIQSLANVVSVLLITRLNRESWIYSCAAACLAHIIACFTRTQSWTISSAVAGICSAEIKLHLLFHAPFHMEHIRYYLVWCSLCLPLYSFHLTIFAFPVAIVSLCVQKFHKRLSLEDAAFLALAFAASYAPVEQGHSRIA